MKRLTPPKVISTKRTTNSPNQGNRISEISPNNTLVQQDSTTPPKPRLKPPVCIRRNQSNGNLNSANGGNHSPSNSIKAGLENENKEESSVLHFNVNTTIPLAERDLKEESCNKSSVENNTAVNNEEASMEQKSGMVLPSKVRETQLNDPAKNFIPTGTLWPSKGKETNAPNQIRVLNEKNDEHSLLLPLKLQETTNNGKISTSNDWGDETALNFYDEESCTNTSQQDTTPLNTKTSIPWPPKSTTKPELQSNMKIIPSGTRWSQSPKQKRGVNSQRRPYIRNTYNGHKAENRNVAVEDENWDFRQTFPASASNGKKSTFTNAFNHRREGNSKYQDTRPSARIFLVDEAGNDNWNFTEITTASDFKVHTNGANNKQHITCNNSLEYRDSTTLKSDLNNRQHSTLDNSYTRDKSQETATSEDLNNEDDWEFTDISSPDYKRTYKVESSRLSCEEETAQVTKSLDKRKGLSFLKTANDANRKSPVEKITTPNILVHGQLIAKPPISKLKETCFNDTVLANLETFISSSTANDLQAYVWPTLQRQLNVIIVAEAKSGKTVAYLPAICSYALQKTDSYLELAQYTGPLVVVLCADVQKCVEITRVLEKLCENLSDKLTISTAIATNTPLKNSCDILVTLPAVLLDCLDSNVFGLKRLCHVVLDNAFDLLKKNPRDVGKILHLINDMQLARPHNKNLQLIATSRRWSLDIEEMLMKIYLSPVVYFKSPLEAAIYSKVQIKKCKIQSLHKIFRLCDILQMCYQMKRSVVFCDSDDEVKTVGEYLELKGVESVALVGDVRDIEKMWNSLTLGQVKVLLCTDEAFSKSKVSQADLMVHYSPPQTWDQFENRFRSFSDNLHSPLEDDCKELSSFLMIEEGSRNTIYAEFLNKLLASFINSFKL